MLALRLSSSCCARLNPFLKIMGRLCALGGFLRIVIAGFVLRIHVYLELRHAERLGLSARRAFEKIMHEDNRRMSCAGEEDSVAHGAGCAGTSGADADQCVVSL